MDYAEILNDIKPTADETNQINEVSLRIINFLQDLCDKESIDAKVALVGSVAKNTALKGKFDIDIFIAFPLDTDMKFLKEKGLYLAHRCCDEFGSEPEHHLFQRIT